MGSTGGAFGAGEEVSVCTAYPLVQKKKNVIANLEQQIRWHSGESAVFTCVYATSKINT